MFKKPKPQKRGNLSQFGLLDIPNVDDGDDEPLDLSDDDIDLEAELAAISGGGGGGKSRPRKPAPVPAANLDSMIAASLKDIPSDEEFSGDEDDPELLNELKELALDDETSPAPPPRVSRSAPLPPGAAPSSESSTISLLQDRISNYALAEQKAKENGESSRARRFGRGLKTLNDLLKQAKAGKPINDEDIPPPVVVSSPAQPAPPAEDIPPPAEDIASPAEDIAPPADEHPPLIDLDDPPSLPEPVGPPPLLPPTNAEPELSPERQSMLQAILKRQVEFKAAALHCKRSGDKTLALEFLKTVKQFDFLINAYKTTTEGMDFSISDLPTLESVAEALKSQKTEDQTQKSTEPTPPPAPVESTELITATTVDEALRQRLSYYQKQEVKAKEDGNSSKARRMGRIVKQYQDAVKLHAAGKPIDAEDLVTPPGYAPLPLNKADSPSAAPSKPSPAPSPSPASHPKSRPPSNKYEKQLAFLLLRQKQFKEAALKAKKDGDIEQAKEYLRAAKGFDSVIEAARGGLPVDLKSLPLPPKAKVELEHTFDVVEAEDCGPADDTSTVTPEDADVLGRLQGQLSAQLKLCHANRDHNRAVGNIAEANRFEHLAASVKQDLDVILVAKSLGQDPPKFHYESRQFSVAQCNTDLNENDLELTIVRGIAYNVTNPKEVDTYVKFEFPYPQDAPVCDSTSVVKDTNSPEYNAVFPLSINRSSRPCLRVFKRHSIKLQVYSRGGWFSRDTMLGTVTVKLSPLETQVTLDEAYPLMDGRRPAGGSLEVKLRVRTPLLQQQIENTTHRWLLIDN